MDRIAFFAGTSQRNSVLRQGGIARALLAVSIGQRNHGLRFVQTCPWIEGEANGSSYYFYVGGLRLNFWCWC